LGTSKAKPAEKQGNQKLPEKAKSGCKGQVGVVDLLRGKEKSPPSNRVACMLALEVVKVVRLLKALSLM
jgi:hypothetical protein